MSTAPTSSSSRCILTTFIQGSFSEDEVIVEEKQVAADSRPSASSDFMDGSISKKDDSDSDTASTTTEEWTAMDSFSDYDNETYSLEYVLSKLTDSEKEAAARVNYQYDCMARAQGSGSIESYNGRDFSSDIRDRAAMMTFRHFYAECNGNVDKALQRMKSSIESREDSFLNSVRHCFTEDTAHAKDVSRRVRKYTGTKGRIFVRGYDKEGRAFLHIVLRNSSEHLKVDTEGEIEAHAFAFEKAIACTEKKTGGCRGDVNLCFDVGGFRPWHVSASLIKELFHFMLKHQVGRVNKAYAIDAPAVFRLLWKGAEAVAPAELRGKVVFLSKKEKEPTFRNMMDASEAMPYQRIDGMQTKPFDVDEYFKLPFTEAYGENMS